MPAYAVRPLMNVMTEAEAVALERREVEQSLERVRSEQRALEAQLEEQRRRQAAEQ